MASSKKPRSSDLASQVESLLSKWVKPGQSLVLGLSGGMDSIALLDVLALLREKLGFHLSAVHVNHQISPNAGRWAAFCAELCQARNVSLQISLVDLNRQRGESLEAVARDARYRIFSGLSTDFVVLAQHLDDQAETLLLQLLRGAGVKGLSAMPVLRAGGENADSPGPQILRPLLHMSRLDIVSYAKARNLQWVHDESNENVSFDRNYLRHRVFPLLERRFPAYRKVILRASRHMSEASALLDELARLDAQLASANGRLKLDVVRTLSHARAKNLLRFYLGNMGLPMPSTERLDEILHQLLDAKADAGVHVVLGDWEIRRFQGEVYLSRKSELPAPDLHWSWQGESELELSELGRVLSFQKTMGQGVNLEKLLNEPVTIRLRQGGERFKPECGRPRRSLKNLLQECQVPPWERLVLPLLYSGENLVFVPGVGIDCAYQARPNESGVDMHWTRREAAQ